MLYRHDTNMTRILLNIHHHIDKSYDNFWVIVGGTGDGKSVFALQLLETWYRVILRQPITKDHISHIHQGYAPWLRKFGQGMNKFDMNIFDESSRDLSSLDFMTKVSKNLTKLFDVCRVKGYFSVVVLPNFFRLNKALREDRIRGLIWVNKRGQYQFYTKEDIKYLNGYNENRRIKSMALARASHRNKFPDYKGVLLEEYEKQKLEGVNEVLKETISDLDNEKKTGNLVSLYKDKVKELRFNQEMPIRDIAKDLQISTGTVNGCIRQIQLDNAT